VVPHGPKARAARTDRFRSSSETTHSRGYEPIAEANTICGLRWPTTGRKPGRSAHERPGAPPRFASVARTSSSIPPSEPRALSRLFPEPFAQLRSQNFFGCCLRPCARKARARRPPSSLTQNPPKLRAHRLPSMRVYRKSSGRPRREARASHRPTISAGADRQAPRSRPHFDVKRGKVPLRTMLSFTAWLYSPSIEEERPLPISFRLLRRNG